MSWIDLSLPLSNSLVRWPGDPEIALTKITSLKEGDTVNLSSLSMGVHSGTHVDAPLHYLEGGVSVELLDLETLIGPAWVAHFPQASEIGVEELASTAIPQGAERILIRTRNSESWTRPSAPFQEDFVAITETGARRLVESGVRLVGVDYLSVAPWEAAEATHRILLSAGVIIVEGLDLSGVADGEYDFICLPLRLMGAEAAPARAVVRASEPRPSH